VNLGLQGVNPGGDSAVEPASFSVEELLHEPLADVVVEGNDTIRTDAILRQIQCRPGRPASSRMIQQDVTQLLNTRWFFTVRPKYRSTDTGPVLVFQVVERPILRKVTFNGNKKIKTAELQAHTGLRENAPYDVAANRESVHRIRQLYKDKGYRFADVLLVKGDSPDDREVIFDIIEGPKPKIWDIDFVGNKFCSSGILRTKISSKTVKLWIIQGDYDPDLIRNDVLALKQYYMGLGFFDVDVQSEDVLSEDKSKVTLTFHITEGQRYKVEGIEVVGNEVIPRERLLKELKLEPGDYFNERFLKEDVSTMTEMYDEQGRLFAKVVPTPRFRDGEEPLVDLVYEIDEDVPRYIGMINVHIRGDYPHSQEEVVIQQVNRFLKPGRLARSFDLRMAQARVTGSGIWDKQEAPSFDIVPNDGIDYWPHVANRGQDISGIIQQVYKEPSDIPDVLAADAPDDVFGHSLAPLALPARQQAASVRARPQEQLPETAVTTLPALPPPAGRKEISQPRPQTEPPAPNVVIDPELVFRGQSPPDFNYRSQSLDAYGLPVPQDFLQRVSPQGDPYGDALSVPPPGFVDVNIDVSEGRTGRLMFGVGVNSDAGLIGSLVLQEDNFNLLRPPTSWEDVLNGQAWRGAGQSLRLEAVPGTQVSRYMATWQDPYFLRSDFSLGLSGYYFNRYYESWTETRMGGRASLGYVLDRYWSTSASLRLEDVEITDVPAGAPTDLTSVAGSNFLSTGSVGLAYDARDNSFFPTRGNYVNLTYEQAFGDFNYPKADLTASQYFTTYERPDGFGKHILSFTGQVGFTGNQTPIFERFFAGGYSSFRGFYFRGVSPVQNGYRVGGDFMLLGSAEYMVPLTANDNIRAVVFSDFGTVEPDVRLDDFRLTAGFGFRVTIPAMGPAPLAFDFAWPIMKEDYDRLRVFSFYVGFTR
jgi:outer membrane protein insertion porin family